MNKSKNNIIAVVLSAILLLLSYYYFDAILATFEAFASWAYPKDIDKNGSALKLIGSLLAGVFIVFGLHVSFRRVKSLEQSVEKQGHALDKQSEQLELTRKAQVDERFKNAIEHLASEKEPVIMGGIAELHQIAMENPREYGAVVFNILTSYIRSTSSVKKASWKINKTINQTIINYLFIGGQNKNPYKGLSLDLSQCNLHQCNLNGIDFENANFSFSLMPHLEDCSFRNCSLVSSKFWLAKLNNVEFDDCNLFESFFIAVKLREVTFRDTKEHIFKINILDSEIEQTYFQKVNLFNAHIMGCSFNGGMFRRCSIGQTNFAGSSFSGFSFAGTEIYRSDFSLCGFADNINFSDESVQSTNFKCIDRETKWFQFKLPERLGNRNEIKVNICFLEQHKETPNWIDCEYGDLTDDEAHQLLKKYETIKKDYAYLKKIQATAPPE